MAADTLGIIKDVIKGVSDDELSDEFALYGKRALVRIPTSDPRHAELMAQLKAYNEVTQPPIVKNEGSRTQELLEYNAELKREENMKWRKYRRENKDIIVGAAKASVADMFKKFYSMLRDSMIEPLMAMMISLLFSMMPKHLLDGTWTWDEYATHANAHETNPGVMSLFTLQNVHLHIFSALSLEKSAVIAFQNFLKTQYKDESWWATWGNYVCSLRAPLIDYGLSDKTDRINDTIISQWQNASGDLPSGAGSAHRGLGFKPTVYERYADSASFSSDPFGESISGGVANFPVVRCEDGGYTVDLQPVADKLAHLEANFLSGFAQRDTVLIAAKEFMEVYKSRILDMERAVEELMKEKKEKEVINEHRKQIRSVLNLDRRRGTFSRGTGVTIVQQGMKNRRIRGGGDQEDDGALRGNQGGHRGKGGKGGKGGLPPAHQVVSGQAAGQLFAQGGANHMVPSQFVQGGMQSVQNPPTMQQISGGHWTPPMQMASGPLFTPPSAVQPQLPMGH